jgi:uncharacterized repeat protein (TIGR01451 family)
MALSRFFLMFLAQAHNETGESALMENEQRNELDLDGDAAHEEPASLKTTDPQAPDAALARADEAFGGSGPAPLFGQVAYSSSSESEEDAAQELAAAEVEAAWENIEAAAGDYLDALGLDVPESEPDTSLVEHSEPAEETTEQNDDEFHLALVDANAGAEPDALEIGESEEEPSESEWDGAGALPEGEALESGAAGDSPITFPESELSFTDPPAESTRIEQGQDADFFLANDETGPDPIADWNEPDWWEEAEIAEDGMGDFKTAEALATEPGDVAPAEALAAEEEDLESSDPEPVEAWAEEALAHDGNAAHSEFNGAGIPESLSWSVPPGFDPSTLEVRRIEPEATAGDPLVTYGFVVRNTAPVPLSNVRVEHALPEGARCVGVLPRPEVIGSTLVWRLGTMEAGAEERFLVRVQKTADFDLPAEATAILHACYHLKAPVARPRLAMTVTGPERVKMGQTAVFEVELKNQGTAPATNLVLRDQIGPCLQHPGGTGLELTLGTLAPGETIVVKITASAVQGGRQTSAISVSSAEHILATGQCDVVVTQPLLEVHCPSTGRAWVGRAVRFTIEVSNPGTAPIGQLLLVNTLPDELEFQSASDVGEFDPSDRSITWILGALEPGQSRAFIVEVVPKTPGELTHHTLAWTDCGLEAHALCALAAQIDDSLSSRLLEQLLAAVDQEDKDEPCLSQVETRASVVTRAPGARGSQYVVFSMRDADYAIPLENVLEYGHPLKVTPVPNVPEWILGVANVHGDIVSMVDLRLFLGQERHGFDEDGRLLVVRSRKEDITVGLIVDRVKGIRVVADEHILQPSSRVEDHLASYVRGVASHNGRLIVLLSLDQLLLSSEMRQFEPV